MSSLNGKTLKASGIKEAFLSSPGDDLIGKLCLQMSKVDSFVSLFGPYLSDPTGAKNSDNQRWADYPRMDWSIRQLPAINIFENQQETKESDNAYLNGSITLQVYWPPNFRRSDLGRIPAAFKGVVENFFSSAYTMSMLDELYYVDRPEKVFGLNQIGKTLTWSPNSEGVIDSEMVPVTIIDVNYRIDLRAWYRALEFMARTKGEPFKATLDDLSTLDFSFDGVDNLEANPVWVSIESRLTVSNP